jgi:hypothetical protein
VTVSNDCEWLEDRCSNIDRGQRFLTSLQLPDQLRGCVHWAQRTVFCGAKEWEREANTHCSRATRHGGAWGERRYSSYPFTTSALDGGELSALRPGRALSPGKGPLVPIGQEAGWAPEPVWTQRIEQKISCPCRGSNPDRPVVQPVVRHYTA